ncbi:EAL domain-containing protein [Wenzhouxiangella sp. XN79A]|uniref:putative bifunctional diguanylate cyclase/phosphodiesterase n=1 Tax=Wenzhouxiangella sp. XN79A TaxID=2724193 RepID=UPI00144A8AE9|nr:EAL domain-containing protein [Wenzhouxiangella sp. XN79A]NKI34536.1 EAL domain-containing protein [Wenzhouxiangella sp. XN79A]
MNASRDPSSARTGGVRRAAVLRRVGASRQLLPMFLLVAVLIAAAIAAIVVSLDFLSATRAFVTGESHWSRAQQNVVFRLDRYAERGDPADLAAAREQLIVPRAAREARRLLAAGPVDREGVLEAFVRAGNAANDVPSMIRLQRFLATMPEVRRALELWRGSDAWVDRLDSLADELETYWSLPDEAHAAVRASIRDELALIDHSLARDTLAFAAAMAEASAAIERTARWLSLAVLATIGALLMIAAVRAARGLRRSERRFWTTFEQAPVGMALIDRQSALLERNEALSRLLQRRPDELAGQPLTHFSHPRDRGALRKFIIDRSERGGVGSELETRYLRPDGSVVWGKLSLAPLDPSAGGDGEVQVAVLEDISEPHRLAGELAYQAAHDQLTGLPNRREFERSLNQLLHRADRTRARHALALVDLDQFKVVNDSFGHLAGDALLVRLADGMQACLREGDLLARLDGDEFGVLLKNCAQDKAIEVVERVRAVITAFSFHWEERPVTISSSIGLVPFGDDQRDASTLLQQANIACHEAKDQGRNRLQVHSDDHDSSRRRHEEMDWVHRINQALGDSQLRFHAQLIQPMGDGPYRCELLLRLKEASGELHTASRFMEAAERFHIARTVDRWVVDHALAEIRAASARLPGIAVWHINLSGQSVDCETMLPEIIERIRSHGVPPQSLCFEVTETAAIHSLDEARAFFGALRELGCRIALDDFGKGLSTFDYLKQLPVDMVKIDGGFVRELAHSELDHAMVRSVHEIARIAGLETVAESVESVEVLLRLRQIGIDYLQGHIIHNPCRIDELELPSRRPETVS